MSLPASLPLATVAPPSAEWRHRVRLAEVAVGQLTHRYDDEADLIRISGRGIWSEHEVNTHFDSIDQLIRLLRMHKPAIRSLVDLREAGIQPHRTSERMAAAIGRIYGRDDRIALVLASSLQKAQMRHIITNAPFQCFISAAAAETWLRAYD